VIAMSLPVGRFFKPSEMACRDGTPYPEAWGVRLAVLFDALDVIREAWGEPVTIVSGYRSPEYNKRIGAVDGSQHPHGRAADLRPYARTGVVRSAATIHAFHRVIELLIEDGKLPAVGGVGLYPLVLDKASKLWVPGWVHCDVRPKPASGHIARWTGAKFGDEQTTV
jgi:uncharacterized protein YcbK (DUF882 family)